MGAARHGQGGGALAPPPGNVQMGICYGTVLLSMHALKLLTVAFLCHTELACLVCIAFLVVCAVQLLLLTCCSKIHVAARVM